MERNDMVNKPNYKVNPAKKVTTSNPTTSYTSHILQGKVYWCKVFAPNDDKKYSLDLVLDAKGVELLSKYNIPIKNADDERGSYATFTTYAESFEGEPISFKENVFDASMNLFNDGLIGNGSLVNVEFLPRDWDFQGKHGTSARLLKLQVLKHIKYGGSKLKVETAFVVPSDEASPFTV
jgi:hypothetical protein